MSKKIATKKAVKRKPYEGNDAKVILNIFTPDYEPQEYTFTIKNIKGNSSFNKRSPVKIAGAMMGGARRFGSIS